MARRRTPAPKQRTQTYANQLVLMARAPRLGAVKSRLARDIGWVAATRFHGTATRSLGLRLGAARGWRTRLAITPDGLRNAAFGTLAHLPRMAQGRGDLGARMQRIMTALPPGPVVIVGTDIPEIRPGHIARAFRLLGGKDAVFGPAEDGGYWLVGLRRVPRVRVIFGGVRWSTEKALDDTMRNLPRATIGFARTMSDVDDKKSHRRLARAGGRVVLPPWWRAGDQRSS